MLELPAKFAEPLPANPFERALFRGVAVDAGEVELPALARRQRRSALIGVLRLRAPDVDGYRRVVGEIAQIDRERGILLTLHQPVAAGRRSGMARDEFFDTEHLGEARLPFRHRRRPGLECLPRFVVAGDTGKSGRAAHLPKGRSPVERPHARILERVEVRASLDRQRALAWIVKLGVEACRCFQRPEERYDVTDLLVVEYAMRAPGGHDGLGVIDARIVDVVEQPLVVASGIADL